MAEKDRILVARDGEMMPIGKKSYRPAKLICHGSIRKRTKAVGSGNKDGLGGKTVSGPLG